MAQVWFHQPLCHCTVTNASMPTKEEKHNRLMMLQMLQDTSSVTAHLTDGWNDIHTFHFGIYIFILWPGQHLGWEILCLDLFSCKRSSYPSYPKTITHIYEKMKSQVQSKVTFHNIDNDFTGKVSSETYLQVGDVFLLWNPSPKPLLQILKQTSKTYFQPAV